MLTIKYQQECTDDEAITFVKDILTVAAEGGINYWADFRTARDPVDGFVAGLIDVTDAEAGAKVADYLGFAKIWEVLGKIAWGDFDYHVGGACLGWTRQDLMDKEVCMIDAECADVIVQLALFGELVYG